MNRTFTLALDKGIATVLFDLPDRKVNVWSPRTMEEFNDVLDQLEKESGLKGLVILSGKERTFIAGADLELIEGIKTHEQAMLFSQRGQAVFDRLAALPVPSVAAIHGACLGGGLELALACTYRVASDAAETLLGLPEVRLGIIPGFGGTQRLPKIVGVTQALRMIGTGSRIPAQKALKMGLVDEVVVRENLLKAARRLVALGPARAFPRPFRGGSGVVRRILLERTPVGRSLLFRRARAAAAEKAGGHYPAPLAAIEAVEDGLRNGTPHGLETEARLLGTLAATEVSRNLLRVFRLKERFSRIESRTAEPLNRIGIVGAGTMGAAIAALAAERGLRVRLMDISPERLGRAIETIDRTVAVKRSKGLLRETDEAWIRARISYDTEIRGLGGLGLVLEAVAERMDVKKSVLGDIARATRGDTLIASNTSSLSITEMFKEISLPRRTAGMHFFNPADKMPLVEVIRGDRTAPATVEMLSALARRLGKIPLEVKDSPGFLVNRLLMLYLNEACRLLEEGVPMEDIDSALLAFGMPMGAFILLDVVGLDIASHAAENLYQTFGPRMKPSPVLNRLLDAERTGTKSGAGFYRYDSRGERSRDPGLAALLNGLIAKPRRRPGPDLVKRLVYTMVSEAARCLEEGIVDGAEAVDTGMVFGAGFPPYTGGLLRYADHEGLARIEAELRLLAKTVHERFDPAGLLTTMAKDGDSFHSPKVRLEEVQV